MKDITLFKNPMGDGMIGLVEVSDMFPLIEYADKYNLPLADEQRMRMKAHIEKVEDSLINSTVHNQHRLLHVVPLSVAAEFLKNNKDGTFTVSVPASLEECEMLAEKYQNVGIPLRVLFALLDKQHFLTAMRNLRRTGDVYEEYGVILSVFISTVMDNSADFGNYNDTPNKTSKNIAVRNKYNDKTLDADSKMVYEIFKILNGPGYAMEGLVGWESGTFGISAITNYALKKSYNPATNETMNLLDALKPYKSVKAKANALNMYLECWKNELGTLPLYSINKNKKTRKSMLVLGFALQIAPIYFKCLYKQNNGKPPRCDSREAKYHAQKIIRDIMNCNKWYNGIQDFNVKEYGRKSLPALVRTTNMLVTKKCLQHKTEKEIVANLGESQEHLAMEILEKYADGMLAKKKVKA